MDKRQMLQLGAIILMIASLLAIIICYNDSKEAILFESSGVKTSALVTGMEFMSGRMALSRGMPPRQVAFDYSYHVSGQEYQQHTVYQFRNPKKKGDTIEIEYLPSHPEISRYLEASANSSGALFMVKLFAVFLVAGVLMFVFSFAKTS